MTHAEKSKSHSLYLRTPITCTHLLTTFGFIYFLYAGIYHEIMNSFVISCPKALQVKMYYIDIGFLPIKTTIKHLKVIKVLTVTPLTVNWRKGLW